MQMKEEEGARMPKEAEGIIFLKTYVTIYYT